MWVQLPPLLFSVRLLDNTPNRRYNRNMNIDLNTIALVVLSAFSAFFGIGYIRARIADRFSTIREEMQSGMREFYAEQDRVYQRINRLEERLESMTTYSSHKRYCNEKPMHDKNYYNSEV